MIKYFTTIFTVLTLSMTYAHSEKLTAFEDKKTKLYGFKNSKGKIVIPAQFSIVSTSAKDEQLTPVVKNGILYRVDKNGNLKFESVFYDNDGIIMRKVWLVF